VLSWPRLAGIAVLGLLGLAADAIPALALEACTAARVIAVAVSDRLPWLPSRRSQRPEPRPGTLPDLGRGVKIPESPDRRSTWPADKEPRHP
jgi:hypothetical protein